MDNDSPEYLRPPHSVAESVQNLGIISFQVERFLQEAHKLNNNDSNIDTNNVNNDGQMQIVDNISDMYLSDSEQSTDGLQGNKSLIDNLRKHHRKYQYNYSDKNDNFMNQMSAELIGDRLSKSGECLFDQVSDSLSILSRASLMADTVQQQQQQHFDLDWFWGWTSKPEYFTGQEWKVCPPKQQELMMKPRSSYCPNSDQEHGNTKNFSGDMVSLLVLTNILSIIIGAGLTYSVLMRRSNV